MALGDNVKTVGQRLTDNGIHAAYVGKWHLDGGDYFGLGRCPEGWDPDYWYDMRNYLDELTPAERQWSRRWQSSDEGVDAEFTFARRCSNRAVDFLQKHNEEDFLLVVSYDEPHDPYLCPAPFNGMYADYEFPKSPNVYDSLEGKPAHQRIWAESFGIDPEAPIRARQFFDCHSFVDDEIGRVLDAVDRHAPDAMVIYTADHGDMLHSHRLGGKGPVAYEEITRVPFIVRWPGTSPAGGVCEHPTSHIDVVPTVLDALDVPVPKLLDGRSMAPVLADTAHRVNDEVFIEFGRYEIDHDGFGGFQPLRCVFDGQYKLAVNLLSSDELYDLQRDPHELVNLIDSPDHAEIRNRLHDRLIDWMNETRDPFRGYYWHARPWRVDAPAATWAHTGMTRQRENEEYEPRQLDYSTGLPMEQATRKK
jgi:uncharacterized sulfatase